MSEQKQQVPSVGRVVHFVNGDQHVPAIITDPGEHADSMQALTVFPPNEPPFTTVAPRSDDGTPATWHWPEFVAPK